MSPDPADLDPWVCGYAVAIGRLDPENIDPWVNHSSNSSWLGTGSWQGGQMLGGLYHSFAADVCNRRFIEGVMELGSGESRGVWCCLSSLRLL